MKQNLKPEDLTSFPFPHLVERCGVYNGDRYVIYNPTTRDEFRTIMNLDEFENSYGKFMCDGRTYDESISDAPLPVYSTYSKIEAPTTLELTSDVILNVVPLTGMASKKFQQKVEKERKEIKSPSYHNDCWYLHGKIQKYTGGYDLGYFVNVPQEFVEDIPNWRSYCGGQVNYEDGIKHYTHLNGIFRVNVLGIDKPCIGVFYTLLNLPTWFIHDDQVWRMTDQRGYVCLEEDTEALEYALNHWKDRW